MGQVAAGRKKKWSAQEDALLREQFEVRRSLDAPTCRLTLAESATHRYGRDR